MTPYQQKCLDFIGAYINLHGFSPSYADIGEALGIASKSSVHRGVKALIDQGHLRRTERRDRSLALVRQPSPSTEQLAQRLTEALTELHGMDDGEGVLICASPDEVRAAVLAALAQ